MKVSLSLDDDGDEGRRATVCSKESRSLRHTHARNVEHVREWVCSTYALPALNWRPIEQEDARYCSSDVFVQAKCEWEEEVEGEETGSNVPLTLNVMILLSLSLQD